MPLPGSDIPPIFPTPSPCSPRDTDNFLLEEYKNVTALLSQNEEAGERRITFLLTLITASSAGLVSLLTSNDNILLKDYLTLIANTALMALLMVGLVTLRRMVKRNAVSDYYRQRIDHIREQFKQSDVRLKDYNPFVKDTKPESFFKQRFFNGGWVTMTALLNSVLVGMLCGISLASAKFPALTVGVLGFVASLLVQWVIVERKKFADLLNSLKDRRQFLRLNEAIAVKEQQRDGKAKEWFATLLSDQLVFRRANGVVVDKHEFLKSLEQMNPFTSRQTGNITVTMLGEKALVTLIVRTTKADGVENRYRNIRLFSKQGSDWRLELWYNYELTSL